MSSKTTATPTVSLPAEIEIFRAGRHTDDSGTVHNFSAADVAGMVSSYNPALREAPLTIGHPADNLPSWGWVKDLAAKAATLVMNTHQVIPEFAEMVNKGMFKKRSTSFYPPQHPNNPVPGKWYVRHVAFLGAQQPAIAGLADFAEGQAPRTAPGAEDGTVNFSETLFNQEQIRMTQELKDQLAASQTAAAAADAARTKAEGEAADAKAQLAQFAEAARKDRVASFTSFAEAQIKTGCLLPKEKDAAVALLSTLHEAQPVSFAEGGATRTVTAVDFAKSLIERAKPVVSFGEQAAGNVGDDKAIKGMSDAEIDSKARAYATQHKVSYAEGLTAVTTFTS